MNKSLMEILGEMDVQELEFRLAQMMIGGALGETEVATVVVIPVLTAELTRRLGSMALLSFVTTLGQLGSDAAERQGGDDGIPDQER